MVYWIRWGNCILSTICTNYNFLSFNLYFFKFKAKRQYIGDKGHTLKAGPSLKSNDL